MHFCRILQQKYLYAVFIIIKNFFIFVCFVLCSTNLKINKNKLLLLIVY